MATKLPESTLGIPLTPGVSQVVPVEVHDGTDGKPLYSNSEWAAIARIGTTKVRVYAHVPGSCMGESADVVGSVDNVTVGSVGQIFRATKDNISNLQFTAGVSAGGLPLTFAYDEDFEAYANTAAMQLVWVPTGVTALAQPGLSGSLKSLSHQALGAKQVITRSTKTGVPATSVAAYSGVSLSYKVVSGNQLKAGESVGVEIVSGVNVYTASISPDVSGAEQKSVLPFSAFFTGLSIQFNPLIDTVDSVTLVTNSGDAKLDYEIDNLRFVPDPGDMLVSIYDLGAALPVSGVDITALQAAFDVVSVQTIAIRSETTRYLNNNSLRRGLLYSGLPPSRVRVNLMIPGNYYAIVFSAPLLPAGLSLDFYGSAVGDYYVDGYAFTMPLVGGVITELPGADLQFMEQYDSTVKVVQMSGRLNAVLGLKSMVFIAVENPATETYVTQVVAAQPLNVSETGVRFTPGVKGLVKPVGSPVEMYLQPDPRDDVTEGSFAITYIDLG